MGQQNKLPDNYCVGEIKIKNGPQPVMGDTIVSIVLKDIHPILRERFETYEDSINERNHFQNAHYELQRRFNLMEATLKNKEEALQLSTEENQRLLLTVRDSYFQAALTGFIAARFDERGIKKTPEFALAMANECLRLTGRIK